MNFSRNAEITPRVQRMNEHVTWGNDVTNHRPHGETTRDILALGQPHPAETDLPYPDQEAATRRHGRRCRRAGTIIIAGAYTLSLTIAILCDLNAFHTEAGQLFGVLSLVALTIAGAVLLAAGLTERRQRPERAMLRLALMKAGDNGARLDRVEAAVSAIAGHLPDAIELANWRGWAAAERKHEAQRTGTDGAMRTRPRMGIVRDPEPGPPQQ